MDHGEETEVSVVTSSDTEDTDGQSESDDLLSASKTVGFNLQTQTSFFEVKTVQCEGVTDCNVTENCRYVGLGGDV